MTQHSFYLKSAEETERLGELFAKHIAPGTVMSLKGDLGAGKTTLARALIRALGFNGRVKSPTYTLVETYPVTVKGKTVELCHFDLYRLSDGREFLDAGFDEYFGRGNICLVEWPENAGKALPKADIEVSLDFAGEERLANVTALSEGGKITVFGLNSDSKASR